MEKIKQIINNEQVGNAFYNLYDRWRDESEYEDINGYGEVILSTVKKQYPNYNISLIESTKKPFGVKLDVEGIKVHLFAKLKGNYLCVCAKLI